MSEVKSMFQIISDGTVAGTRLFCNGVPVPLVQKIEWSISTDGGYFATAVITTLKVPIEVVVGIEETVETVVQQLSGEELEGKRESISYTSPPGHDDELEEGGA
jgi:hypothetical protein